MKMRLLIGALIMLAVASGCLKRKIQMSSVLAKKGDKKILPQIAAGALSLPQLPEVLRPFVVEGSERQGQYQANLESVRGICNFLTDRRITTHGKFLLPKKGKAFQRHVKIVCEELESSVDEKRNLVPKEIDRLYELALIRESFIDKATAPDNPGIWQRIKMGYTTLISDRRLVVNKKGDPLQEAVNLYLTDNSSLNAEELSSIDPPVSPFWHQPLIIEGKVEEGVKRFDNLAKAKKINRKKKMVVLFRKLSLGGSSPKVVTEDLDRDNQWSLKWGDEIHSDVVASRLFAALGYDVDHPFYFKSNQLTLVFQNLEGEVLNAEEMIIGVYKVYGVDIGPWVTESGLISKKMAQAEKKLEPFIGKPYMQFVECALEGRPDRVKRLGSIKPNFLRNADRRELRGSLLAHLWVGNWDTREENTMLSTVHYGDHTYRISGAFNDLGTSMGVKVTQIPPDFKVGVVNQFPWILIENSGSQQVKFNAIINTFLPFFERATYADLRWMALKIAALSEADLKQILGESGWPKDIQMLYIHKLAARRGQILQAFSVADPHPIKYDVGLTLLPNITNGRLVGNTEHHGHPEGLIHTVGRKRNFNHPVSRHLKSLRIQTQLQKQTNQN